MRTRPLRAAALAVALLAFGASACSSPLGSCGVVAVVTAPLDSLIIAVGDSAIMAAQTISSCPATIGPAVTFSSNSTAVATVRPVADTLAWVRGIAAGRSIIIAQSRDRGTIRSGIVAHVNAH